jgi:hypothetical protein
MRVSVTLISILSLLPGLIYAPFFHIHEEEGVLHAHFPEFDRNHHESDHDDSTPSMAAEHGHHHGSDVSVVAGRTQNLQSLVIDLQSSGIFTIKPALQGFVINPSFHGPGPPAFRDSNPRSPPA